MNRKVRAIIVDGTEIMTSLTAVEIANRLRTYDDLKDEVNRKDNIINELEKWLKMIPKYFMDERSLNNGVYIEQGMQKQIDLTLDKLKELKENVKW